MLTQTLLKILRRHPDENFTEVYASLKDKIEDRYYEIYDEEIKWIDYLFSKGSYIGMNSDIMKNYLNYLFIRRIKSIGYQADKSRLNDLYITKNPLPWVDTYINMDKKEKLPQSEKILNYVTGGVDQDITKEQESKLINKYI